MPLSIPSDLASLPIEQQIVSLKNRIALKEHEIQTMERHNAEVASLSSAIATWKNGCYDALNELSTLIPPPHNSTEEILKHLGIPEDLIDQ